MNKMRSLVSMAIDDEDKFDTVTPIAMPLESDYPYHLRFALTHKEFAKLQVDPNDAAKGQLVHFCIAARVTDVNHQDGSMGRSDRVEFQIEDMSVDAEDDAEEDGAAERLVSKLYNKA